jgi:hypothetical protein
VPPKRFLGNELKEDYAKLLWESELADVVFAVDGERDAHAVGCGVGRLVAGRAVAGDDCG